MARVVRGNSSHIDGAAQVWAEATAFRDGDPDVAPLKNSRPIIAGVMGRPRSVLVVALDDDDRVMAFAVAAPARDLAGGADLTAEVEYTGVRPGTWGGGLAHAVMELMCSELAADGFTGAQLMVYVTNSRAVSVYKHLGWQAAGDPRPHPRTGKPEQRYCRALGA
jgi:ribosomal protein S18 acetylase RimI-like enzyme